MGNTRHLLNSAGTVIADAAYTAWGNHLSPVGSPGTELEFAL